MLPPAIRSSAAPAMRAVHAPHPQPRKAYIVGGHVTKFVGKGHPDFVHKKHPDFGKRTNPELKDYIFESVQVRLPAPSPHRSARCRAR